MVARVDWSPMLELYELTAKVKDEQGHTLMKGLSAKACSFGLYAIGLLSLVYSAHVP